VVDHLGAAIARVRWNGTYGLLGLHLLIGRLPWSEVGPLLAGVGPWVTGPAIRSHRPDNANGADGSLIRAHILRWISSAVGDETWEFLVDPVDLMGGHHRSRRARSAVSGNCC